FRLRWQLRAKLAGRRSRLRIRAVLAALSAVFPDSAVLSARQAGTDVLCPPGHRAVVRVLDRHLVVLGGGRRGARRTALSYLVVDLDRDVLLFGLCADPLPGRCTCQCSALCRAAGALVRADVCGVLRRVRHAGLMARL